MSLFIVIQLFVVLSLMMNTLKVLSTAVGRLTFVLMWEHQ
jgi:hypothetical protein